MTINKDDTNRAKTLLPLQFVIMRLKQAASDSLSCGYVTAPLEHYMKELQSHPDFQSTVRPVFTPIPPKPGTGT